MRFSTAAALTIARMDHLFYSCNSGNLRRAPSSRCNESGARWNPRPIDPRAEETARRPIRSPSTRWGSCRRSSTVICRCGSRTPSTGTSPRGGPMARLLPASPAGRAAVQRWLFFQTGHVSPACYPIFRGLPQIKAHWNNASEPAAAAGRDARSYRATCRGAGGRAWPDASWLEKDFLNWPTSAYAPHLMLIGQAGFDFALYPALARLARSPAGTPRLAEDRPASSSGERPGRVELKAAPRPGTCAHSRWRVLLIASSHGGTWPCWRWSSLLFMARASKNASRARKPRGRAELANHPRTTIESASEGLLRVTGRGCVGAASRLRRPDQRPAVRRVSASQSGARRPHGMDTTPRRAGGADPSWWPTRAARRWSTCPGRMTLPLEASTRRPRFGTGYYGTHRSHSVPPLSQLKAPACVGSRR